ncbi:efflux RND transporter periplasmic adaptor subunit [Myroides sp. LJL119]
MYKYYLPLVSLVLLLTSCAQQNPDSQNTTISSCLDQKIIADLGIENTKQSQIQQTFTLTGQVSYNKDKTLMYNTLIEGVVEKTYFELGDFVQKGQVLALVQSVDLNDRYQELQNAKAQLVVAQREFDSFQQMYEDGLLSEKEFLQSKSELKIVQNTINSLTQNLSKYNVGKTPGSYQIKAPITGYIVEKDLTTGMNISPSEQPLFTIADLSDVWVMANVYTINMAHIHQGQSVLVNTMAYPEDYFAGKVNKISRVLDQEQRVLKAQITLDNTDFKLRPGMTADIIVQVESQGELAVAVPNRAIIFDNNQNYVVVYKDSCNQEVVRIEPVGKNKDFTYTKIGLKGNERIITNNALFIYQEINNPF